MHITNDCIHIDHIWMMIIFWGPVTAMRRSKNPKIKKVTVVQVTPARGFDGVATAPRKKAKI